VDLLARDTDAVGVGSGAGADVVVEGGGVAGLAEEAGDGRVGL
jgi:hypothetical protein